MKRILSALLAVLWLASYFPAAHGAVLQSAPVVTVAENRLLLDGKELSSLDAAQTEFALLHESERGLQLSQLTALQLDKYRLFLNPSDIRQTCVRNLEQITLSIGDTLYARRLGSNRAPVTEWGALKIDARLFSVTNAGGLSGPPLITMGESEAQITLPDEFTRFEYAIAAAGDADASWVALGSAYENGSPYITVRFRPRGTPFELRIRVENDEVSCAAAPGTPVTTPKVFLYDEAVGPFCGGDSGKDYRISYDGGKKFTSVSVSAGAERYVDLAKVFGKKEVEIVIVEVTPAAPPAPVAESSEGDASAPPAPSPTMAPSTEKELFRTLYQPRALLSKDIKVFPSSTVNGNFTFTGQSGQKCQYRVEGQSGEYRDLDFNTGLPVLTAAEQSSGRKPAKLLLRVSPDESGRIPASLPKKYSQPKQPKAPTVKPDYKNEMLKVKSGQFYAVADEGTPSEQASFLEAGDTIDIAGAITEQKIIYVYQGETDKKPRSAVQTIRLAPRYVRPDSGEGITMDTKGKLKLTKGFEIYGEAEKWGNLKKGETQILVRRKTDAKFNSKTGLSSGNAASLPTRAAIAYSEDGKTVTSINMEAKAAVPLAVLEASASGNIHFITSGGALDPAVFDHHFAQQRITDDYYRPLDSAFLLYVQPKRDESGASLAESIAVTQDDRDIEQGEGYFLCDEGRLGSVYTLTLTPADKDIYRTTVYTFTIVEPLSDSPIRATFGTQTGEMGVLTVRMPRALGFGDSLTLTAKIMKLEADGRNEAASKTVTFEYNPLETWWNGYYTFDFSSELANAGRGVYRAVVYAEGEPGFTSQSVACESADLVIGNAELKLSYAALSITDSLIAGNKASVSAAAGQLGNPITGLSYQWVRSSLSTISGSNPGADIPNATGESYTFTAEDAGFYVGVRVTASGGIAYATAGLVEKAVTLKAVSGETALADTKTAMLAFSYDGLDADYELLSVNASSSKIHVRVTAPYTPAIAGTGQVLLAGTPVIYPIEKVIRIPVTALCDGIADVNVTLVVGSGVYGYQKSPQPTASVRVNVDLPESE